MTNLHATCVAFGRFGVLIRGPSGCGKSSLALRLIDGQGYGIGPNILKAKLVADDQVMVDRKGLNVSASTSAALTGRLEIRGLGIVTLDHLKAVNLRLVVDLLPIKDIPRMPELAEARVELLGVVLPRLYLDAQTADAAAKLRAAVVHLKHNNSF